MLFFLAILPFCVALRDIEPPVPATQTRATPVEGWVDVRLNHFDATDEETFPMRYYYNSEFAAASSADVVIFVGGEWSISPGWVTGGQPHELAEELEAGLFYTEHRYYGQTRPTDGTSVPELRYLTVDQALADLVQFIRHVTSAQFENGRYVGGSVALIGCSYAGSMATWMKLAYPHTVAAVFSDSGPLHAQEDFPEYLEKISTVLQQQGGSSCVESIERGMRWILDALSTDSGAQEVSGLFNTCAPLNRTNWLDLATFHWYGITESFAYLVQYARPGEVPAACDLLTDETISNEGHRLAGWINSQSWAESPCLEARYDVVVDRHRNTSYDAPDSVMRLWTYQTCVEFGWFQTTSGSEQPFLNAVPHGYFHQMCKDFFDDSFDTAFLHAGITRSNLLFGGLMHLPDGSVSTAGSADPWSPMGPNTFHQRYMAPVYVVQDASHCRVVGSSNASDASSELERVKVAARAHVRSFLRAGAPAPAPAAAPRTRPLLLAAPAMLALLGLLALRPREHGLYI